MSKSPYIADRSLVPRIQKYLEANVDNPSLYISIDTIAEELQKTYKEYARLKKGAFQRSVKKAYSIVMKSYDIDEEDFASEIVGTPTKSDENVLNDQLLQMYKKPTPKKNLKANKSINVSDDDDDDVNKLDNTGFKRKINETISDNAKRKKFSGFHQSNITFSDIGGMNKSLQKLSTILWYNNVDGNFRIKSLVRILLHGAPGCGKTLLANAIAGELNYPMIEVDASDVVEGTSSDNEQNIRKLFKKVELAAPCTLYFDEIDKIAPQKQNTQTNNIDKVVYKLKNCFKNLNKLEVGKQVIVIGETQIPESLDPSIRSFFNHEVYIEIPDVPAKSHILKVMTTNVNLSNDFDHEAIVKLCPGFVGKDLKLLVAEALKSATIKESESFENTIDRFRKDKVARDKEPIVTMDDFIDAIKHVQPSVKKEGFATIPTTTWDEIGSMDDIKKELRLSILNHDCSWKKPSGVLLFGPPGCGKTLVAKALANEMGINFLSVKGPELLNMYLGESERAIRTVFAKAKSAAPCVIFFDEIDSICKKRSLGEDSASSRVVGQLLTEMNGVEGRHGVYILAATNRPEIIDPGILRPGRLSKKLYVGLPSPTCRASILRAITKNGTEPALASDVNLEDIGRSDDCDGFTGADLYQLVEEAYECAREDYLKNNDRILDSYLIRTEHFESAMKKVSPSVTEESRKYYEKIRMLFERNDRCK